MRLARPLVLAAVIAALALLAGGGVFVARGGLDTTMSAHVSGGGTQVVRVALVDATLGFDVNPDVLEVDRGTHLVLEVVNEGDEEHDLAIDGGRRRTRVLDPGESERLDLGLIGSDRKAWCTLPAHKFAGMTLDIQRADVNR